MNVLVLLGVGFGLWYLATHKAPTAIAPQRPPSGVLPAVPAWPLGFGPNGLSAWGRFEPSDLALLAGKSPLYVLVGAPQAGLMTLSGVGATGPDAFIGYKGTGQSQPFTAGEVYGVAFSTDAGAPLYNDGISARAALGLAAT